MEADAEDVNIPDMPDDLAAILKRTRAFATEHPQNLVSKDICAKSPAAPAQMLPSPVDELQHTMSADRMQKTTVSKKTKAIPFVLVSQMRLI